MITRTDCIRSYSRASRLALAATAAWLICLGPTPRHARGDDTPFITLASTTSTENSGLLADLLPRFKAESGIDVHVVAVGTGRAIRLAEAGDADVLLVHDRASEEAFVAAGHGVERFDVMYNDFVIVGPADDPAKLRGLKDVREALRRLERSGQRFLSRGDDSGTHKMELRLWQQSGLDPSSSKESGSWYLETGSGMGATLNTASGMNAYTLTDRATWLYFANKGQLELLVDGDPRLYNYYGIIRVSEKRHPHVKATAAQTLIDWILSRRGQEAIAAYKIGGQQAFFPNARSPQAGN